MARVVEKTVITISEDVEGKQLIFKRDDALAEQKMDGFLRGASSIFNIALSSNEDMNFGDVDDVRGIYIEANGDFDLVFNGGAEVLSIKLADTATGRKAKVRMDIDTTQVNIANPDTALALTGAYAVWGDIAP